MDGVARVQEAARLRDAQDMDAALAVICEAVRCDPNNPQAAFGHAQIAFEAWQPASHLFERARRLLPDVPDLVRNHALSLAAEGEQDAGEALLESFLARYPGWLEGHRTIATLCETAAHGDGWDKSYRVATQTEPTNSAIWLAWFQQLATRKDWSGARAVLEDAKARFGDTRAIDLADIYLICESGQADEDTDTRFAPYLEAHDPGTDLCHIRHLLRRNRPDEAEAVVASALKGNAARIFWPYASLCWRLLGDGRASWLEGDPAFVRCVDLEISGPELARLADTLRALHRLQAPYPEQSVRGGTQTDRNLLLHPDPAIRSIRARFDAALRDYAEALPPPDPDHPLLAYRPDAIRYEGSWSVRLLDKGFHSAHTHTHGWLSSAFYVALPEHPGEAPAGWFSYGGPPSELSLPVAPYGRVEPRPGRLVIFPSTLWHGTEPFEEGERLTIAFDVRLPQAKLA